MKYTYLSGIILVALLSGCKDESKNQTMSAKMPPAEVGFVQLKSQTVPLTSELTGRTTATEVAEIRPQISGVIQKRLFKEGDYVKAGDILYQIDDSTYQAAYEQAQATLKNSQAQLQAAKAKAWRYGVLIKNNSVSKEDVENAQSAYKQVLASISQGEATVKSAKIDLDRTKIKAPISGTIGISSVTPGALVIANQDTALATIRNLDNIYVDLTQSSVQQLQLRKYIKSQGSESDEKNVTLKLEDGSVYQEKGKLEFSEVSVNESTGSVTLRATFANPDHLLLPGMFVRATIINGMLSNAILAPQQGITRNASGEATALLIDKENKIKSVELKTDKAIGNNWLITSGLKSGDKIVVEGNNKIQAGQVVKPVDIEQQKGIK